MRVPFLLFLFVSFSVPAWAEKRTAHFYEIGKVEGAPIYIQNIRINKITDTAFTTESEIIDQGKKVILSEVAHIEGGKITRQTIDQKQIDERYELEVVNGEANFKIYKAGKISESGKAKATENFITGPLTETFLKPRLKALKEGKKVNAEFGIFEYVRTIGFEFSKSKNQLSEEVLPIEMKPLSFWLSLLVDPIYFEVDAESGKLIRYKGRTPIRRQVKGEWKPVDAEIIYIFEDKK